MTEEIQDFRERTLNEAPRLGESDSFRFACRPGLSCFGKCCTDVNVVLTPYDVLRLRRRLGLGSEEFLKKHTIVPFTKEQALPVRLLRMADDESKSCPFVEAGSGLCSVYEDRPWPCRMYPVGAASPAKGSSQEKFYFLIEDEPCEGFSDDAPEVSVRGWMDREGVGPYDEMGELLKGVTLHPRVLSASGADAFSPEKIEMYHMALYELDRFRRFIFESTFLERFEVGEELLSRLREDDEELLRFSMEWLRMSLLGERVLPILDAELDRQKKGGVLKKG